MFRLNCLFIFLLHAAANFCAAESPQNATTTPESNAKVESAVPDTGDISTLVSSNNALAFLIYENIKRTEENLVFSPYSLSIALGMVYAGADGSTQSQMARVLRYPLRAESLGQSFALLNKSLSKDPKKYSQDFVLNSANALWIQRGQPILPQFSKSIADDYRGIVKIADFTSHAEEARMQVNAWVKERTQGKIPQLFGRGEISNMTRMLLLSAVYMNAKWLNPFDASLTQQTPFYPSPTKSLTVPMMTVTGRFSYVKTSDFALVELPYDTRKSDGLEVGMYLLLPQEIYGLGHMENLLDDSKFRNWIELMKPHKVVVSLPRFKVSGAFSFEEIFSRLGMTSPFSDSADFSKIDGNQDLKLSKIVQKSFINVDEKGTEASASTGISAIVKSVDVEAPEVFVADHPYLFFVVDKSTKAILFMGKIASP